MRVDELNYVNIICVCVCVTKTFPSHNLINFYLFIENLYKLLTCGFFMALLVDSTVHLNRFKNRFCSYFSSTRIL